MHLRREADARPAHASTATAGPSSDLAVRGGRRGSSPRHRLLARIWRHRVLYLMLLVPLAWFVVYRYLPMYGIVIAFKDYNLSEGMLHSPWAHPWYKYFAQFVSTPYFKQLLTNTFLISLYKLVWGTCASLALALLINECRISLLKRAAQTLSYMPYFLSWVIIYGIAVIFLSESDGFLNRWLGFLHVGPIPFLTSPTFFRSVLVGSDVWKDIGWGAIIYLAAMVGVDPSRYEAARVDGASRLRTIWHVTLPGIRSVILILLVLKLGNILDAGFEQVYIFYNVQVYSVGDIIDTWVFRTGLQNLSFSLATAVGLFKSVIGFVLILGANQLAKRWDGQLW